MKLFPRRNPSEVHEDRVASLIGVLVFAGITGVAAFVFLYGGSFPPGIEGLWNSVRWGAALVALVCAYLTCQAILEFFIHMTVGIERFLALIIVLGIATTLFALFAD